MASPAATKKGGGPASLRDQQIRRLERELKDRDVTIKSLQAELKEFKFSPSSKTSSLHPLLNKTGTGGPAGGVFTSLVTTSYSGVAHDKIGRSRGCHDVDQVDLVVDGHLAVGPKTSEGRIKRLAFSAEPLSRETAALEEAAAASDPPEAVAQIKEVERWPKSLE